MVAVDRLRLSWMILSFLSLVAATTMMNDDEEERRKTMNDDR